MKNRQELKETATLIRDYLMLQKRISQIESWTMVDEGILEQIIKDCDK